jgi:L-ascorbate metabolism protein UlaG (beta-lactamase superfamily)
MADLKFRWLGVAGVELDIGDQVLAIDPFVTRPRLRCLCGGRVVPNADVIADRLPRCDHVLVTHAHWDHIMDVPELACQTGSTVLGSTNTCRLMAVCGVPEAQIRRVQAGDSLGLGRFQIDVLPGEHMWLPGFGSGLVAPALHPPLRLRDYRMDECFSFLIAARGWRVLVWHSIRAEKAPRADILFVGPTDLSASGEALLAAVQPQLIVPVHWDDPFRPLARPVRPFFELRRWALPPVRRIDLNRFAERVRAVVPEAHTFVPEVFRTYALVEALRPGQVSSGADTADGNG